MSQEKMSLEYMSFRNKRRTIITYVQSYYMMVNKDIVCLQKIQEEKKWNPSNLWIFFFNLPKLFLIFFNFFTEKSIILSWLIQITAKFIQTEQLKWWNILGCFFCKKAPIFFVVLCKKIKPQRNMTSIEVTYQASVDCRLWF